MPRRKRRDPGARADSVIDAYHGVGERTDPQGMYTGVPNEARMLIDPADPTATCYRPLSEAERRAAQPVQDADDL